MYLCLYLEIYYKELAHTTMEAKKFQVFGNLETQESQS